MKRLVLIFLSLVVTLVLVSCCPKNPPLNSVKTAHGNADDWHIDTAEEFLTGKAMDGTTMAVNHCPNSWTKTHMHVGMTNTNVYYYDKGLVTTGQDYDSTNGIDQPMLFFYAGHGWATDFDTLGNDAYLTNMKIGNCQGSNDGTLRYYWQCSCEVFAHGPRNCSGTTHAYACPEDFDGSADSYLKRNVYERWGPILHPDLRMACGSSTEAYCWHTETNKIWDNYNNNGYDVADSFIEGLRRYSWNTPLCITTGGLLVKGTPLFDTEFKNDPNPSGSYYHIQYLSNFATTAPPVIVEVPELLPIFRVIPLPLPDPYRKWELIEKEGWLYSKKEVKDRGPALKVYLGSGTVYAFGERKFDRRVEPLLEKDYIQLAKDFIKEHGWSEKDISEAVGARMIIDRLPINGKFSDIKRFQKNVVLTFKRTITIAEKAVNFVGQGGVISIQLNNDGSLLNASKVWRKIKEIKKETGAKKYEQAYEEALEMLGEKDAYKLANWTWGYKEATGLVKQTELKAVYIFNFLAANEELKRDHPPRIVEISAHLE